MCAGLAQIVASTGTDFLGMDIDVRRSQELTDEIAASERRAAALRRKAMQQKDEPKKARALNAAARKQSAAARQAEAERVRVDPRFDPAQALEGMATYLSKAEDELGREDLAVTSYHMGIGNLLNVIEAYGSTEAARGT